MRLSQISIGCLFFISICTFGQIKQTVTGIVSNGIFYPLTGANIQLNKSDSTFQAVSDADGKFKLSLTPGRYWLKVSFTGYTPYQDELLVIAGKSNNLKIQLTETTTALEDVEVKSITQPEVPGGYSIGIEKTMRVPANFFDPVRMATSLPGVVATNDQGNSISIKGYSPNAMLWRLNGLDIVNPNHLANAGTLSDRPVANGGGVSILSSQVLDKTSFYSGTLPVQYGNVLSGAMDMALRPGSKTTREHTVQASLIGIDLATEGPIGKSVESNDANASYLVNYRYSTVGLLSQLGVNLGDETINFQDLTFNLDFSHQKGGNLSVFGFGGLSSNRFDRKEEKDWETEKDRYNIDFNGKVFGVGFMNTTSPVSNGELKFGVSASGQFQERTSMSAQVTVPHIESEYFKSDRTLISSLLSFRKKQTSIFSWETGVTATSFSQEIAARTVLSNAIVTPPNPSGSVNGILWQPYCSTNFTFNFWRVFAGVRYANFTFNKTNSIEPRLSIHRVLKAGSINFSYGIASQIQQTSVYLLGGNTIELNKAHQFSMGYSTVFQDGLRLTSQVYYHQLFDIAVAPFSIPYSVLNQMEEWTSASLESNGRARNYGVELSLEKKFVNKIYFLATGSLYNSEFSGKAGEYYSTRYNGNFTSSLTGGKEWSKTNKVFGIHTRILYLGGMRQSAIDAGESPINGFTVYDNQNEFPVPNPDYFRIDLRASWRKNKPGYTRTISIDIQNLTAQQNVAYRYFDTFTQKVERKNQLGLIPVIVYRVDF